MSNMSADQHLTLADLVCHMDEEGDELERAGRQQHLDRCAGCAERAQQFQRQEQSVSEWLGTVEIGSPAAAGSRGRYRKTAAPRWLRAAAVLLLIGAPIAAHPAVREWLAEQVGTRQAAPVPDADPVETPPRGASSASGEIRFVPAPGVFTVQFKDPAAGAELFLARSAGADAVLRNMGADDEPLISENAIRIITAGSAAGRRYELHVPSFIREIRVVSNGRRISVLSEHIRNGRVIDLSTLR